MCVTLSQNERYLIRPLIEAIPAGYPSVVTRKTRDAGENDTMADAESTAYELQEELDSKAREFGRGKYGRILKMAHTPSREEYAKTLYITGLGIVLIGAVGFAIWWLMTVLPDMFRGLTWRPYPASRF